MKSLCLLAATVSFLVSPSFSAEKNNFYLKNGDRVVFYGDSITDQRQYTTFTELFAVTRFPELNATFVHSGWGGDRVTGGGGGPIDLRLKRDVAAYNPTVMTSMLAMNDGSYRAFDDKIYGTFTNGYQHIVDSVKKEFPHIRITLIQPSPFDDVTRPATFEGGYNKVLIRYGDYVKDLAEREHVDIADLNTAVVAALEKANGSNHELALKIVPDRVHPGASGHLLMAAELLKAWHAPAVVSMVEIDASSTKVTKTERAHVTDLAGNGNLTWTEKDEALPMPVDMKDGVTALAINSSDFMDSLNRETMKVTGLAASKYNLKIDGEEIGSFSKEALGDGINLALSQTPMWKQAQEVLKLTRQHNDIHFVRWRQIQVPFASDEAPHMSEAMHALDDLEKDIVTKQHAAAQPKEHKYELTAE